MPIFYQPAASTTGELADMDLAIITGSGPDMLTNMMGLKPYVKPEHVIHIGQRDAEQAAEYGSQDIRETGIHCFDLGSIRKSGLAPITEKIINVVGSGSVDGFWLHFDTDVIDDNQNPAVDYRLPGGLSFIEAEMLMKSLLARANVIGMSVSIFNPNLDKNGKVARQICACLAETLNLE